MPPDRLHVRTVRRTAHFEEKAVDLIPDVKRLDEAIMGVEWAIARIEYIGNVMIETNTEPRLMIWATVNDVDTATLTDIAIME